MEPLDIASTHRKHPSHICTADTWSNCPCYLEYDENNELYIHVRLIHSHFAVDYLAIITIYGDDIYAIY